MQRIILSLALIVIVGGVITFGATKAFFSDTETSAANTFTAGDIDLKIDNESYYNGVSNPETSWSLTDLTIQKFFDFDDLKPNDYGEDTISLHIDTNDAYMCANVTLTSNNENGQTEPESEVDLTTGTSTGELAGLVEFIWWGDDGDNVLEDDEEVISQGPLGALTIGDSHSVPLADSDQNIWTGVGGPVPGDETLYIGKAWCFGDIGTDPVDQDGENDVMSPAGNNNDNEVSGEPEDGGITCDGSLLGNESQTDSLTADVRFEAVQARNNNNFQCEDGDCPISEVQTLIPGSGFETPEVTNGAQWDIFPSPAGAWNVEWRSDVPATFGSQNRPTVANLELHEGVLGLAAEGDQYAELDTDWAGPNGSGDGEPASVTIYQDIPTTPGNNYRIKYRFAARPDTSAADNRVEVRWGGDVVHDTGNVAGAAGPIVWTEYVVNVTATTTTTRLSFTDMGTANSLGSFIDDIRLYGESCEPPVEEDDATLTLAKVVVNNNFGNSDDSDFILTADGPTDISGIEGDSSVTNAEVAAGVYTISESGPLGYASSISCSINGGAGVVGNQVNIAEGDNVVCTITNDDIPLLACEVSSVRYADSVVSSDQGTRKNGTPVTADRSNTSFALGAPQSAGTPYDNPTVPNSFYSLGFNIGSTTGGEIVVGFTDNYIVNGPGNDLKVFEVTGGTTYPDEHIRIEASQDGINWIVVAPDLTRDAEADLGVLPWARFVKLVDVSPIAPFEAIADGYDLDAFSALNCATLPIVQIEAR